MHTTTEVQLVALRPGATLTTRMSVDDAFQRIGAASATGASVQMRKIRARDGQALLIAYTQTAGARSVYTFQRV